MRRTLAAVLAGFLLHVASPLGVAAVAADQTRPEAGGDVSSTSGVPHPAGAIEAAARTPGRTARPPAPAAGLPPLATTIARWTTTLPAAAPPSAPSHPATFTRAHPPRAPPSAS